MRLEQYASDAKAYVAIAGGVTVSQYDLDAWAAYASLLISVLVISEKLPGFIQRLKPILKWFFAAIKKIEILKKDDSMEIYKEDVEIYRKRRLVRNGFVVAALSTIAFFLGFALGANVIA